MVFNQFVAEQVGFAKDGSTYQFPAYDDAGVIVTPGHPLYETFVQELGDAGYDVNMFNALSDEEKIIAMRRAHNGLGVPRVIEDHRRSRSPKNRLMRAYAGMDEKIQADRSARLSPFTEQGIGPMLDGLFGSK